MSYTSDAHIMMVPSSRKVFTRTGPGMSSSQSVLRAYHFCLVCTFHRPMIPRIMRLSPPMSSSFFQARARSLDLKERSGLQP